MYMKYSFSFGLGLLFLVSSCGSNEKLLTVTVKNPINIERSREMVEIPLADVLKTPSAKTAFKIVDEKKNEIAYQITHDNKVIFPISLQPKAESILYICEGKPSEVDTLVCGDMYPSRLDDVAWENDVVGFRVYGPALQKSGERGFGYDIFTKRDTTQPMLKGMYELATSAESARKLDELWKTDSKAAAAYSRAISYHVDKGHGMDCYGVGPTLGAGVAALVDNGKIVYPWCYKTYEILDNGPLRFSVKFKYALGKFNGQEVTETRYITLDLGSYLNHTRVSYANVEENTPLVTGIVMHHPNKKASVNAEEGFMAYEDPTTGQNNGKIFVGHVFLGEVKDMAVEYFSPEEKKMRNNALGHALSHSTYVPDRVFEYYWGAAWNKANDIKSLEAWQDYLKKYRVQLHNPLQVKFKGRKLR